MTTGNHQDPNASERPDASGAAGQSTTQRPQRQRMGGYTPLPHTNVPAADEAARLPQEQRLGTSVPPAMALGMKQRMGGTTAPFEAASGTKQRIGDGESEAPVTSQPADNASLQRLGIQTVPTGHTGDRSPATPRSGAGTASPSESALPSPASPNRTAPATEEPAPSRWPLRAVAVLGVVVAAVALVLLARWARSLPEVMEFIQTYPGHSPLPDGAPVGLPVWMGWQHFLNMFFLVLIVRTGLQVRQEKRAPGYWKPKPSSFFSPKGNTPKKVSLSQWLHQVLDVLWVANGAVFIILLAVTGHWVRIVPTSWEFIPNAASTAIQYVSLNWPLENGWVHYNALQVGAYFLTVYVAAPLAILSGLRMSTWWPTQMKTLNKVYPLGLARSLHFPVMLYFVAFTLVHVFLVFFTGALRNLNHMYTSRDVVDWWGLGIFVASILVIAAAWFLTKPIFTTPLATRMGTVTKN